MLSPEMTSPRVTGRPPQYRPHHPRVSQGRVGTLLTGEEVGAWCDILMSAGPAHFGGGHGLGTPESAGALSRSTPRLR